MSVTVTRIKLSVKNDRGFFNKGGKYGVKVSRGRFNLYKLLCADEIVRKHLIQTELFSKQSLTTLLNSKEPITIKAAYGAEAIGISFENNRYLIQTCDKVKMVKEKEAVYCAVKNEMAQKYYIIQKSPATNQLFRQFVTIHRNNSVSDWYVASKTKNKHTLLSTLIAEIFFKKVQQIIIRSATQLGKSFPTCHVIVLDIAYDWRGDLWIFDWVLHFSNSKWSQYHVLRRDRVLRKSLPKTDLLTQETFRHYLHHYNVIIIKPCIGQNGIGILQIRRKNDSIYEIHTGMKKIIKTSLDEAFHYLKHSELSQSEYIVQQRIDLATINNCPIDIRVITQKVNATWIVTGKIVKVAGEQFFITNAAQKLLTLEQALKEANSLSVHIRNLENRLDKISLLASKRMEENSEELSIIGFDIGLAKNGSLWMIEGNTVPDVNMFKALEDPTMYHTIIKGRNTNK